MSEVLYLTVPEVIEIHAQIMESMRERPTLLRSPELLESAVMKPQAAAYYAGADLASQTAVLAVGISRNQPFLDGNKRTAYAALKVFLAMNGERLASPNLDVAEQLVSVAERDHSLKDATEAFADWIRSRLAHHL